MRLAWLAMRENGGHSFASDIVMIMSISHHLTFPAQTHAT